MPTRASKPPTSTSPSCGCVDLAPALEHSAVVLLAIEPGQREEVLALELRVVVDEGLLARDAELREQVPELDHVGERAALVVRPLGDVAAQGLFRLVEELVVAGHRCVPRVLGQPGLDLPEDREVGLVHLVVGLVAERTDQHAAERVQVEPRDDVRMARGELHHRARLRRAARVVPGADLLGIRRPLVREVAVEVVEVVAEKERIGDAPAVEVGDAALGIELVVRSRVLRLARHHHRGVEQRAVLAAKLHELAVGALLAHVADHAVAVDVGRLPVRRGPC